MRVTLVGVGTRGDVQPLIVLGRELQRRGHDIVVGVPPNLVDFALRAELAAQPVGPDSQAFVQSPEGREMLASGNVKAFLTALGKVGHDNLELSLSGLLRVMDGADLVVSGTLSEEAVAAVAEAYRIPVVFLHHAPKRRTRAYPAYLVTTRQLLGMLNLMTGDLLERVTWKALGADVNTIRSRVGLGPVTTTVARRTSAEGRLELQGYSSVLVPGIREYGPSRPIIGFLSLSEADRRLLGEAAVETDLDAWSARGEAPAYFGFGSMPIRDPDAALDMIGRVTERLGLRALISAGWSRLRPPPAPTIDCASSVT
jgi:sterol 3beta-glucosyltransferase